MKTPLIVFYKDINENGIGKIDRRLNLANEDRRTLDLLKKALEDAIRYLEIGQEEKLWGQNAREDERQKTIDRILKIIAETEKNEKKLPTPNAFGFRLALEQIKQGVEAMKGEQR